MMWEKFLVLVQNQNEKNYLSTEQLFFPSGLGWRQRKVFAQFGPIFSRIQWRSKKKRFPLLIACALRSQVSFFNFSRYLLQIKR